MNAQEYLAMYAVEDSHWWYVGLRHEITTCLKRYLPRSSIAGAEQKVLDAGCGTGGLLARLQQDHGQWNAGVDLVWEGLALSQGRGLKNLFQGSVTALPFRDHMFDAAVSIDVLCHTGVDEAQALREFARVLRPGGIVILQLPAFEWLRSEHDAAVSTKRRYTRQEVERLMRQAGLTIQRSGYRNTLLFPALVVYRMLKRGRSRAAHARSDVRPVPPLVNACLTRLLWLESACLRGPLRRFCGLSVFCVARKADQDQLAS